MLVNVRKPSVRMRGMAKITFMVLRTTTTIITAEKVFIGILMIWRKLRIRILMMRINMLIMTIVMTLTLDYDRWGVDGGKR